ncbi:hypothetical protein EYR36_003257 [Pleurotus pulmonarius]|nr:hypothetical protein EYR36_003257 [Pleurotus pulmonarius]
MVDLYTKAAPPVVLEPPALPQDQQYVPQPGAYIGQYPPPLNQPGLQPYQTPSGPSPPIQQQIVQLPPQPFMQQPGVLPQQVYAVGMPPAQVYYQPQPMPNMMVVPRGGNRNVNNLPMDPDGRQWSYGLCEWGSDFGTCLIATFFPCIVYAQNKQRYEHLNRGRADPQRGGSGINGDCFMYSGITFCFGIGCIIQIPLRGYLRRRLLAPSTHPPARGNFHGTSASLDSEGEILHSRRRPCKLLRFAFLADNLPGRAGYAHSMHLSPKKKAKVEIDDLFAEVDSQVAPSASSNGTTQTHGRLKKRGLTSAARVEHFNQLVGFVSPRLGKKPEVKTPRVRKSVWTHLVGLASTQDQLEKVVELLPKWKDMGCEFGDKFGDLIARRCDELSCPLLALKVFGDYSRYGVKMTLVSGRHLIHSLHIKYPIEDTIAAASLYSVYSLPPIAQDLPSCSMLVHACYKHNSKHSLQVADALVPRLRTLLESRPPLQVKKESPRLAQDPSPKWLLSSLKQLDQVLYERNGRKAEEWLRTWRSQSGYAKPINTATATTP